MFLGSCLSASRLCSLPNFSSLRSYATVNGLVSSSEAQMFLAQAPKSRRNNRIPVDKIYLYHLYREMVSKRATFFIQINNMKAKEYAALRLDLKTVGFRGTLVRNSLYKAALRDSCIEDVNNGLDPAHIEKLKHLFVGPTCVVSSSDPEIDGVALLNLFAKTVATKERDSSKYLILGAKFDRMVLSADEIAGVRRDYPMGSKGLHAQLLGMLETWPTRLVDAVERGGGRDLTMALENRDFDGDETSS